MRRVKANESDSDCSYDSDIGLKNENIHKNKCMTRSTKIKKFTNAEESSSSESDIESYFAKPENLNLNSSFFKSSNNKQIKSFGDIENAIFDKVVRLSESDSDLDNTEEKEGQNEIEVTKAEIVPTNFQQLTEYTQKIEKAKKHLEMYNACKKQKKEININIGHLLEIGEKTPYLQCSASKAQCTIHSSDFESYSESEKEDWEEVPENKEISIIPKDGVEITLKLPDALKKKKGVDLLAAMKRRFNLIKKECQVYIHKVHLLTWIAHGNYINGVINKESVMAMALSLIPSQHCYPLERINLKYLEQILSWYRKNVKINEKRITEKMSLEKSLLLQISRREVNNKHIFIYIFIAILRSLGIQCRLVLSLQVEPLKPPASKLCSLSTKTKYNGNEKKNDNEKDMDDTGKVEDENNVNKSTNKSESTTECVLNTNKRKSVNSVDKVKKQILKLSEEIKGMSFAKQNDNKVDFTDESKLKEIKSKNKADSSMKSLKRDQIMKTDLNENEGTKFKSESQKKIKGKKQVTENPENVILEEGKLQTKEAKISMVNFTKIQEKVRKLSPNKTKSTNRQKKSSNIKTTVGNQKRKAGLKVDVDNLLTFPKNKSDGSSEIKIKMDKLISKMENLDKVAQVDGCYDDTSDEGHEIIPQLDGRNDTKPSKPDLKRLKDNKEKPCPIKCLPRRQALQKSEDDLKPSTSVSPFSPKTLSKSSNTKVNQEDELKIHKSFVIRKRRNCIDAKTKGKIECKSYSENTKYSSNDAITDDIVKLVKKSIKEEKLADRLRKVKKKYVEDSDSDFDMPIIKKRRDAEVKVKRRVLPKHQLREQEEKANTEKDLNKQKKGLDIWFEVYLEAEEKWISGDIINGKIHCVKDLYNQATHPVSYILSWNNSSHVKDITKRYCTNWNTVTRKLRVDPTWWEQSLRPFIGKKDFKDKEEDDDLARQQLEQPLPKTISEYKNHPLYVLQRHLLKFQAIYPPDALTLGFVRNEPVYSRDCVYILHSREIWLKQAKVVKLGEKPYKIVKARPKYDKLSNNMITDQPLEIFGPWQIEDYIPPTAQNGIVPRNSYGNVELFKACMLPKKTVHLQLPGLNKVARKLNIDCAPAVVGFDYQCGGCFPMFDGFVVCEEDKDRLIAAWYLEQEKAEKREQEKYEKRVYGNWRKLIKGLLIRERLKRRYDFGEPSNKKVKKEAKAKVPKFLRKPQ